MSVPGKCHFDADGWIQGAIAIAHTLTPNRYNSGFAVHGRGVVLHTEAGFEAGTKATFLNPASQVSAFFSIGSSGAATQYLPVGHGYVGWSQAAGNATWRGIEDEDGTHPSVPLTSAQIATFAQILEACAGYDGFPLQVTDDVSGTGLITHSAGGAAWGGHTGCPGPVRAAQRPAIVALAKQIRAGGANVIKTASGKESLHQIAAAAGIQAAHVLRLTAIADGTFPPDVADYVNKVFAGTTPPSSPMPAGCKLWVPPSG
jgi:hypothetical protein